MQGMYDARMTHRRYLLVLAAVFAIVWVALAIAPWHRADWALENVVVLVFVAILAISYQRFTFNGKPPAGTRYVGLWLCGSNARFDAVNEGLRESRLQRRCQRLCAMDTFFRVLSRNPSKP